MKTKQRAFTLVEVIVVFAVFLMILLVGFTFFMTNNKIVSSTEIKSDLQTQGEDIQQLFIEKLTQSRRVVYIKGANYAPEISTYQNIHEFQGGNPIKVERIIFEVYEENNAGADTRRWYNICINQENGMYYSIIDATYNTEVEENSLKNSIHWDEYRNWKCIGKDIKWMSLLPIDYNNYTTEADRVSRGINKINALNIEVGLSKKRGTINNDYSIKSVVEFRNYSIDRDVGGEINYA